jgi:hypothetical protein
MVGFFAAGPAPRPQGRRFAVRQLHHRIQVSKRRICDSFVLSPSSGPCHGRVGCAVFSHRSTLDVAPAPPDLAVLSPITTGSAFPVTNLATAPSRWTSRGRGLVSHRSWTQAPLTCLLVAHTEEALADAPEQHGCTTMEIEVAVVEVVVLTPSPVQSKVATSLPGCTDNASSQVISHKRGRFFSDEARRCRRRVFSGMVSGSLDAEEGPFRVHRSSRPSDAPGARNVEDSPCARASLAHCH